MARVLRKCVPGILILAVAILLIAYYKTFVYLDEGMEAIGLKFERESHIPNASIRRPPVNLTILKTEMGSLDEENEKNGRFDKNDDEVAKLPDRNKQIAEDNKQDSNETKDYARHENKDTSLANESVESIKFKGNKDRSEQQEKVANIESMPVKKKETEVKVPADKNDCREWFEDSFEDNLNHISQYPGGVAENYMHTIVGNLTKPRELRTDFPVIATAANSAYYLLSQGLLKSVYEKLVPRYNSTLKVVFYDIGLKDRQRKQLIHYCGICEVRKFPFGELPKQLRTLKTYTWKPVIVKKLLLEFGWVWWMDTSVRLLTNDLDRALKYSQDHSMLYFTNGVDLSVALNTDTQTMQYFNEDSCKYRHFGETESGFVLYYSDNVTNIVVDKWVSCALNQTCMAPKGTEHKLLCRRNDQRDGRCHRFDQSVLGILLRRLYHERNNYPLVAEPFHIYQVKRADKVVFFPELSDKKNHN